MKIIIQNHNRDPVFTIDVEAGKAKIADGASMDAVGLAFVQSIASIISEHSAQQNGRAMRDFLLASGGGGPNAGNWVAVTGDGSGVIKGEDIEVLDKGSEDCSKCDYCNGLGAGIFGMRCHLCHGAGQCTLDKG